MQRRNGTLVRMGVAVASAGLLFAAAPAVAGAQVPGVHAPTDRAAYVVTTGDSRISVAVAEPDVANGRVLVTVQNNTGGQLSCGGFDGGGAIEVATDEVVSRSIDHYSRYAVYPEPKITTNDITIVGVITVPLGSVTDILPAAAARHIWPEQGSRSVIASKYDDARMRGQIGRHTGNVTVPANSSTSVTVPLAPPSKGNRTAFNAGALVGCDFGGIKYVYAGFSPDTPKQGGTGSLDTSQFGRFGS